MLFDIVRELNEQMTMMLHDGMPGKRVPLLVGITDGYDVSIQFMDRTVWNSSEWEYRSNDEAVEIAWIKEHIQECITDQLTMLYNIQF